MALGVSPLGRRPLGAGPEAAAAAGSPAFANPFTLLGVGRAVAVLIALLVL